jgi:hypothetical protein
MAIYRLNVVIVVWLYNASTALSLWPKPAQVQMNESLERYLDRTGAELQIKPKWCSSLRSLIRSNAVRTLPVLTAMVQTDRSNFCCLSGECDPYDADYPAPIECGATVSEAWLHAVCLEQVQSKLHRDARAMDIGTGSG